MRIRILSFTDRGERLARFLAEKLTEPARSAGQPVPENDTQSMRVTAAEAMRCGKPLSLSAWTERAFSEADALVFVGACGIAVRAVAPFVRSKASDPAVVAVDETGRYAVSLLSGHLGGANALAGRIAAVSGAEAVITTATDRNGVFAVDEWARTQGCVIPNPERIKNISSRLLAGGSVRIYSDWPVAGSEPEGIVLLSAVPEETPGADCDAWLSFRDADREVLHLVPRIIVLGVGCRQGVPAESLEEAFRAFRAGELFREEAVRLVCSIDRKAEEPGLLAFCENHGWPLVTYTAEELKAAEGSFSASAFVQSVTGVDNVCERSAVLGSGGTLFLKKWAAGGVTMAAAAAPFAPDWRQTEDFPGLSSRES